MSEVEKALKAQRRTWVDILNRISKESYSESLPWKKKFRRVLLFGEGSSFFASKLAALSVIRGLSSKEGRPLQILALPSTAVGLDLVPGSEDLAIGLSHRGQTPVTLKALELCRKSGAFTVLVTGSGVSSPFQPDLLVPTCEVEKCEPHTIGMTGAVCAVTVLLLGSAAADTWKAISEMPDPDLSSCRSKTGEGPSILLGEWEGEWIAHEISLKLLEMAGVRALAYGSEEYFHGPAASALRFGRKDQLWYVSAKEDLRGAQIQAQLKTSFESRKPLAWLPALVEFQWMSLAVALNLGVNPDGG